MNSAASMNRRAVLKLGGAVVAGTAANAGTSGTKKSVIVVGAGIAGLSCAYELTRYGHQVTVLEASGRPGGHVRTLHDPFADGLYADMGAEHFYYPGYTQYWRYLHEFGLTAIHFPRRENLVRFLRGERFNEADLHSRAVLAKLGFKQQEITFLADRPWSDLPLLYAQPFVDRLRDEADPFAGGLDQLDHITVTDLLKRENASTAALEFFGSSGSALQMVWGAGIKKLRGTDLETKKAVSCEGRKSVDDGFICRPAGRKSASRLSGQCAQAWAIRHNRNVPQIWAGKNAGCRLPGELYFTRGAPPVACHARMA